MSESQATWVSPHHSSLSVSPYALPMDQNELWNNYFTLCDKVQNALRTQMGDAQRLDHQRDEVLAF
jgi:hypothetical protein